MNLEERVSELLGSKADQKWDMDFFTRYHEDFELSGLEKGRRVLEDLKRKPERLNLAKCAYFSIGGSTGSEVFHVMNNSEIGYGLLLEYDPDACQIAKDRADELRKKSKELLIVPGDATQQLERCKAHLLNLRKSQKIDGLIVSAQAVLHEMPFRSPGFDLSHYMGEVLWDWDPLVCYVREPCSPVGWPDRVEIQFPGLTSSLLESLASDIQNSLSIEGRIQRAGPDSVSMPATLAVETITKIFYLERYKHEIEEQLTIIKPEEIQAVIEKYLGPNSTTLIRLSTNSFIDNYRKFGIVAKDSQGHQLSIPQVFCWIVGERIFKAPQRSTIHPSSNKTGQTRWFTNFSNLSEPIMKEGPFGFGVFTWDDFDPNNPDTKLVLRVELVESIISSLEFSSLHIILGKSASGKTALAHEVGYHLMRQVKGNVFYLDLLNLPTFDDKVYDNLCQDLRLISSQQKVPFIIIDNAHVNINDTGSFIQHIITTESRIKLIVTMVPDFFRRYMTVKGNPLLETLDRDDFRTVVRGSDIAEQMVARFMKKYNIPFEEFEDLLKNSLIIGENLYELQILLSALLEEVDNEDAAVNINESDKMDKTRNEWESYGKSHVSKHLKSIRDGFGDDGILTLATIAVWSQFDIGVERNFLIGTEEHQPVGLGIPEGLINFMIASGDLCEAWGFLHLPHRAIAGVYLDAIRSTPVIESLLEQYMSTKTHISGDFESTVLHSYLQYRPHSIDIISKQICNRNDLLSIISKNSNTIDAIVDMIISESDIKKKAEIFINFEWLNRKLSEEMMTRLQDSIDVLLPEFNNQSRIGPIIHFIAPMWYVTGDILKKSGKTLLYEVEWEDISKSIALDKMECKYIQAFGTFSQYRETVLETLEESGLSQENKEHYRTQYLHDDYALKANSFVCIKTFLYKCPLLCAKAPIADNRPGLIILQGLREDFLASLLDSEAELINIAYALSVITYFDQDIAGRVIEHMNLDALAGKINAGNDLESAACIAAKVCSIQPSLKKSFLPRLNDALADYLRSTEWT